MPNTRVLKPQPAGTRPSSKRASSCPRCYQDNARDPVAVETRGRASKATSKARAAVPTQLKATQKTRTDPKPCELQTAEKSRAGNLQLQPSSTKSRALYEKHSSHKAFTVFAPDPKKRQDIQKKAEGELAALEDLRLSRAMGYVSISPSTVGGCLTLEEVRIKQQEEMQTKRQQKQIKKYALETSPMAFG